MRWYTNKITTFLQIHPQQYNFLHNPFNNIFFNQLHNSSLIHVENVHVNSIKSSSIDNIQETNYILSLYVKASDFSNAEKLFDEMPQRDVRSWTILISGYSRRVTLYRKGLEYFRLMVSEGVVLPNEFTLASVFKCCGNDDRKGVGLGKSVHGWIFRNLFRIVFDVALQNAVLDFYAKCGSMRNAGRLFELMENKSSVSWNIMMTTYLREGDVEKSVEFFRKIPRKDTASWNTMIDGLRERGFDRISMEMLHEMVKVGPLFDEVTFSTSLALVSSVHNLELGRQIHGRILRMGMNEDAFIRGSLIDMYCKCGRMNVASIIFNNFQHCRVRRGSSRVLLDDLMEQTISWNTMISGYLQNGMINEALNCFRALINEKAELNEYTLASILSASGGASLLDLGEQVHANILKCGHMEDVVLSSSMIDMYSKCGNLDKAWSFFRQAKTLNVVLWTTMISSYATHGHGDEAINLFEMMRRKGILPNEVTFVGVINACSHSGLVQEGCNYFRMMTEVYGILPAVEHFTSMVDLFGRAGRLNEIIDFINVNGISHFVAVWSAFLSSCYLHKNVDMAKWVSRKLLELDSSVASSYILLSNTCSAHHIWDEAATLRSLMQERKIQKLPGQSWI
ncbi:hypothetical protein LIER_02680 [Lithospermum erythrorhizon]|uniref:Pentatricopeptide repeat-containing protein n=1 Tax=Lithospermum erythrorhizon TaxID=34254 RepID=A0AAV3NSY5_LITER